MASVNLKKTIKKIKKRNKKQSAQAKALGLPDPYKRKGKKKK